MEEMCREYRDALGRARRKIEKLKMQESACHAAGEHQAAWGLSRLRMQYESIEGDLLYAMAELAKGGAAGGC